MRGPAGQGSGLPSRPGPAVAVSQVLLLS